MREYKELKPSVIDGLSSNELSAPYGHTLSPLRYAPEMLFNLLILFFSPTLKARTTPIHLLLSVTHKSCFLSRKYLRYLCHM